MEYDHDFDKDEIDHRATVRVDVHKITKTARYAFRREGDRNTQCQIQGACIIPQAVLPPSQGDAFGRRMPSMLRGGPL